MDTTLRSLLFTLILTPALVFAATREDFDAAYAEYQQLASSGDTEAMLIAAEKAHRVGAEVFGKDSINTANLALNYATLLNEAKRFEKAETYARQALRIQQDAYGRSSPKLIDALVQTGKASVDFMSVERQGKPRAFFYFRRAQKIAQKNLNPVSIATVNREIGLHLASIGTDGTEFFEPAHEIYRAELGEADFRTALMAFHLGNIELSKGNHKRARNLLESSVRGFETHDSYREFEMTARGFLIAALEELGQREEATRHCLVIGEKKPLAADEEMTPVYRQPPAFPKIALRNFISGFALVEFTVDEQGFTQNHQVVDASSQVFHNTSIESAKTLRFAPRFVDGEPVATDGVTFRFGYEVVGDRPFSYIKGRN